MNIAKPRIIQKSLKRHRKCLIKYQKLHSATNRPEMVPLVYIDECLLLPVLYYNYSRLSSWFNLYEQTTHHALNMAVDEFRKYVPQPILIVRPISSLKSRCIAAYPLRTGKYGQYFAGLAYFLRAFYGQKCRTDRSS